MAVRWLTPFIDHPTTGADSMVRFWQMVTGSALSSRRGDRGQFATLIPPDGDAYLRLQETDDGSAGIHIDLHVDDVNESTEAAMALGARVVGRPDEALSIMRSPAGMTFCFVQHHGEKQRPSLTTGPTASYTFDQISIDIPFDRFESECSFWAELTEWPLHGGSVPEFRVLARHDDMPVRVLLQRLGVDDGAPMARAHLDAAVGANGDAIASWHTSLGAKVLGRGRRWITLLDPAGLPYCLTERDPDSGTL